MAEDGTDGTRIVGTHAPVTRRSKLTTGAVLVAAAAWVIIWSIWLQTWSGALLAVVFWMQAAARFVLPPTVIDSTGIQRRWRRRHPVIRWPDVASVAAPQPGVPAVVLRLTRGGTVTLDDVPAERSAEVAALGGTALTTPPPPAAPPPPRPEAQSEQDLAADAARRAERLEQGWAELRRRSGWS
ncbi:hypothetical protein [Nakamurella leprariae]|uniref:PH domain-containing protein n=1 Tax=Nakamurella leprariae TaxID=2803911 RepID=A0A939BY59_9ACTN|nr:hypothetical protein [Nakamurella leprariae]MBM9466271.1 hypothetical protein [Nakamurella leprariae]